MWAVVWFSLALYGDLFVYVAPATPGIEPDMGDPLGELGRDVSHRILWSTQAASRAEQTIHLTALAGVIDVTPSVDSRAFLLCLSF